MSLLPFSFSSHRYHSYLSLYGSPLGVFLSGLGVFLLVQSLSLDVTFSVTTLNRCGLLIPNIQGRSPGPNGSAQGNTKPRRVWQCLKQSERFC